MATPALRRAPAEDNASSKTLNFLQELLHEYHPRNFAIELWDGTHWDPEPGQFRRFTWKISRPGAVRTAFTSLSQLSFAEAYIYGDFDFDGNLEGVCVLTDFLLQKNRDSQEQIRLGAHMRRLPPGLQLRPVHAGARLQGPPHSKQRDRQAFSYHYDVSNDFYSLWLGKELVYSSGYFTTPDDDLETAQKQKLDYLCHQLRLQPGERLLDVGCGWGALAIYATENYGVNAHGITLSSPQQKHADDRIREEKLAGRCQVKLLDYRDLAGPDAYDKIVSVGMVEHIGQENLDEFFRRLFLAVRPGGMFVLQTVAVPENHRRNEGKSFTELYVMPDRETVSLGALTRSAELAGFELRETESLREHFTMTARLWAQKIEAHAEQARRLVDEVTYRIWRLHVAQTAHALQTGRMNFYQIVMVKNENGCSGMPLVRTAWSLLEPRKLAEKEPVTKQPASDWSP